MVHSNYSNFIRQCSWALIVTVLTRNWAMTRVVVVISIARSLSSLERCVAACQIPNCCIQHSRKFIVSASVGVYAALFIWAVVSVSWRSPFWHFGLSCAATSSTLLALKMCLLPSFHHSFLFFSLVPVIVYVALIMGLFELLGSGCTWHNVQVYFRAGSWYHMWSSNCMTLQYVWRWRPCWPPDAWWDQRPAVVARQFCRLRLIAFHFVNCVCGRYRFKSQLVPLGLYP